MPTGSPASRRGRALLGDFGHFRRPTTTTPAAMGASTGRDQGADCRIRHWGCPCGFLCSLAVGVDSFRGPCCRICAPCDAQPRAPDSGASSNWSRSHKPRPAASNWPIALRRSASAPAAGTSVRKTKRPTEYWPPIRGYRLEYHRHADRWASLSPCLLLAIWLLWSAFQKLVRQSERNGERQLRACLAVTPQVDLRLSRQRRRPDRVRRPETFGRLRCSGSALLQRRDPAPLSAASRGTNLLLPNRDSANCWPALPLKDDARAL